ncbi:hypothetical protein FB45DRAFT_935697 [Roridomyces roridus]|uniref:F-box domain-containing protein n=1 Tax=Roridomyces roridus TaxID=1738132 RepID=A0AAD7BB88_9AGAR|nr:hypothetical protein FB45DRAFT_935697 [Roridomyces roridus]
MNLLQLPAEVLCFTLAEHCDVSTVVSAAQTCRALHVLAFSKTVWLGLVEDLKQRFIVDTTQCLPCSESFRELSVKDLIKL